MAFTHQQFSWSVSFLALLTVRFWGRAIPEKELRFPQLLTGLRTKWGRVVVSCSIMAAVLLGGYLRAPRLAHSLWNDEEYAIRRNDTVFAVENISYGTVSEMEILLWSDPNISAVARYDNLEHRDMNLDASIARFTWGVNTTALGGRDATA